MLIPRKTLVVLSGFLLTIGVLVAPVFAQDKSATRLTPEQQEKVAKVNSECLACHSPAGFEHPPQEGLDLKALRAFLKDPEAFKGSDHRQLACTKCHNDGYEDFPHAEDAKDSTTSCPDCHAKISTIIEAQFDLSVHAKNLSDTFTCTTCHDPHVMRLATNMTDAHKIVAQDNHVCLSCHDSDEKFAKFAPEKQSRPPIDDLHSWLPNTRLHWKSVRCVECHTAAVPEGQPISHEIFDKEKAEKKCLTCHSANSSLKTRLYRHLITEEQQRLGFANSVILSNSYVLGVTRHPLIDTLILLAFGAMFAGLLVHGLARLLSRRMQKGKKDD